MGLIIPDWLPKTWVPQNEEVLFVPIQFDSEEYKHVTSKLKGTALKNTILVYRIQNPFIYGRYLLHKEEYYIRYRCEEKILVHVTNVNNVLSIATNNLDRRLVKRKRYGCGISFSPFAKYADEICYKLGKFRAIFLMKVIVGVHHEGFQNLSLPPTDADTTTDVNKQVYVKYYDDEFYPEYVVFYYKDVNGPIKIETFRNSIVETYENQNQIFPKKKRNTKQRSPCSENQLDMIEISTNMDQTQTTKLICDKNKIDNVRNIDLKIQNYDNIKKNIPAVQENKKKKKAKVKTLCSENRFNTVETKILNGDKKETIDEILTNSEKSFTDKIQNKVKHQMQTTKLICDKNKTNNKKNIDLKIQNYDDTKKKINDNQVNSIVIKTKSTKEEKKNVNINNGKLDDSKVVEKKKRKRDVKRYEINTKEKLDQNSKKKLQSIKINLKDTEKQTLPQNSKLIIIEHEQKNDHSQAHSSGNQVDSKVVEKKERRKREYKKKNTKEKLDQNSKKKLQSIEINLKDAEKKCLPQNSKLIIIEHEQKNDHSQAHSTKTCTHMKKIGIENLTKPNQSKQNNVNHNVTISSIKKKRKKKENVIKTTQNINNTSQNISQTQKENLKVIIADLEKLLLNSST